MEALGEGGAKVVTKVRDLMGREDVVKEYGGGERKRCVGLNKSPTASKPTAPALAGAAVCLELDGGSCAPRQSRGRC